MENNCELFNTASNIAQQLKTMSDYVVGDWVAVPYGNQWFPGLNEEVRIKILYFLLCKSSLIATWSSF